MEHTNTNTGQRPVAVDTVDGSLCWLCWRANIEDYVGEVTAVVFDVDDLSGDTTCVECNREIEN